MKDLKLYNSQKNTQGQKSSMTLDLAVISGYDTEAKATEANIDKWDCIKLQNSCASKVTNKRVKRQPTEWQKIFANHTFDKQLICPWDFPGNSTGVDCHFLLQGIFLTQGLNPGLPHCRQTLYCLSHQGSPIFRIKNYKSIKPKYIKMTKDLIDISLR